MGILAVRLEIAVLLAMLYLGSAPQGKKGNLKGLISSLHVWQLVCMRGIVLMPVLSLGNL